MLLLTFGGGAWFFYDGKFAWPAKNLVYFAKEAFDAGGQGKSWSEFSDDILKGKQGSVIADESIELLQKAHSDGRKDPTWLEFSKSAKGKSVLKKIKEDLAKDAYLNGAKRDVSWEDYAELKNYPKDKKSAMELGADAVLVNTAIAQAANPGLMGEAFKLGVQAGRKAYLAGRIPQSKYANPSSPTSNPVNN